MSKTYVVTVLFYVDAESANEAEQIVEDNKESLTYLVDEVVEIKQRMANELGRAGLNGEQIARILEMM